MGANSGSERPTLTGSTWGHERGFAPLIALDSQHPDLFPARVKWDIRTLQQFADQSMSELSSKYDLIVFDHPWTGEIASKKYFYPLDDFLSKEYLEEQSKNSVGKSYESYIWKGHLYGLQIDAAGHVSASRDDLFTRHNLIKPKLWKEVLEFSKQLKSHGLPQMALSLDPVNIWCLFITLAANQKFALYKDKSQVLPFEESSKVLNFIIELSKYSDPRSMEWNPIHLLDAMSSEDKVLYCPSLFGYSTYSVEGFRKNLVTFGPIPSSGYGSIGGILGGAGIGITRSCKNPEVAAKVIEVIGSPEIQRGIYARNGGQPGHRLAWLDPQVNKYSGNFYANTLKNLDDSYLRPTFPGFIEIQTYSGEILAEAVYGKTSVENAIKAMDALYRKKLEEWAAYL